MVPETYGQVYGSLYADGIHYALTGDCSNPIARRQYLLQLLLRMVGKVVGDQSPMIQPVNQAFQFGWPVNAGHHLLVHVQLEGGIVELARRRGRRMCLSLTLAWMKTVVSVVRM